MYTLPVLMTFWLEVTGNIDSDAPNPTGFC